MLRVEICGEENPYITLLQVGFVDNGLSDAGVLQDVLADVGIHLEDFVGRGLGLGIRVGGAMGGAIALLFYGFRHGRG